MIEQKGVKLDGETLLDFDTLFPHPGVLQVGKRRYVKVV
jgi:tyrosyl-tRNA synthetase